MNQLHQRADRFQRFTDFYPFYLSQHADPVCRRLHFAGTCCVMMLLGYCLFSQQWGWLWLVPLAGYGFAWLGHFFFEKNRPATFTYPLWSLFGDFVMFRDMLLGKVRW